MSEASRSPMVQALAAGPVRALKTAQPRDTLCSYPADGNHFMSLVGDLFTSRSKKGMQLLAAISARDIPRAKLLIARHASLTAVDECKQTALHLAAMNRVPLVALLVSKGADVNAKDQFNATPLLALMNHWRYPPSYVSTYIENSERLAESLVNGGADVNVASEDGRTVLHHALSHRCESLARLLVSKGADVNRKDARGDAALHCALEVGFESTFYRFLLDHGADVNLVGSGGRTPLRWALFKRWSGIAELFRKAGAVVTPGDPKNGIDLLRAAECGLLEIVRLLLAAGTPINDEDERGATALGWALQNGHPEIAALLIENGADVTASFACNGTYRHHIDSNTLLHVAVGKRYGDLVNSMLVKGAEIDVRDRQQITPLIRAARANDRDMVALLVDKGADVDARDADGRSAIDVTTDVSIRELLRQRGAAVDRDSADGSTALFRLRDTDVDYAGHLLESGVAIDQRDNRGNTALIVQTLLRHTKMVRFLVERGADIHAPNESGTTALLQALHDGNSSEIAELLIHHGADVNRRDNLGNTPLRNAALFGLNGIVSVLLERGANPNVVDDAGLTPLMWACRNEHALVANLLVKSGAQLTTRDNRGRLALHWALERQQAHMDIAECLVANGSPVDAEALTLAEKNRLRKFLVPLLNQARARGPARP